MSQSQDPSALFETALDRVVRRRQAAAQAATLDPKQQKVAAAAERKKAELASKSAPLDGTAVGVLNDLTGLSPDSLISQHANRIASFVSGASRIAGNMITSPLDSSSMETELSMDQATLDAYVRRQQGQPALPGDAELLDRRVSPTADMPANHPAAQAEAIDQRHGRQHPTAAERLDSAVRARKRAEKTSKAFDISSIVYQGARQKLGEDLRDVQPDMAQAMQAWDSLKQGDVGEAVTQGIPSLGRLLVNFGDAAIDNPQAASEYIFENMPQVLMQSMSKPLSMLSNVGYGVELYRKGILDYQAKHNGRYPPKEQMQEMASASITAGMLDQVADASVLKAVSPGKAVKAFKGSAKAAKEGADTAADAGRQTLKQTLLKPIATQAEAVGIEGGTEAVQAKLEGIAQDKPVSAMDVYEAGAIGAITAGGIAAPRTAIETAQAGTQGVQTAAAKAEPVMARYRDKLKARTEEGTKTQTAAPVDSTMKTAAEQSGDITPLSDPKSEHYNPEAALKVLLKRNASKDVSADEKAQHQQQADQVVTQVEDKVQALRAQYGDTEASHEDTIRAKRAERVAELNALPSDAPTEQRADLEARITKADELLAELDAQPRKARKQRQQERARLERAEQQLRTLTELRDNLNRQTLPDAETRAALVEQADSAPDTEGSQKAADEVIRLAMEAPDSLDPGSVERLVKNTGNGLSEAQRTYLARFSEARQQSHAAKGVKGVNRDVFQGGKGYVGIEQYRARFAQQLRRGDTERAQGQLEALQNFAQRHADKARAARQALEEVQAKGSTTKRIDLAYTPGTGWQRSARPLSEGEREANGAMVIDGRSTNLVASIEAEAQAAAATAQELQAAYALRMDGQASSDGLQYSNNATSKPATAPAKEASNAATVPPETVAAEPDVSAATAEAAPAQSSAPSSAQPAEPAPQVDSATQPADAAPEPARQATVNEASAKDGEAAAQPQAELDAGTAPDGQQTTTDTTPNLDTQPQSADPGQQAEVDANGTRYDPETGEILETPDTPNQDELIGTPGEGKIGVLKAVAEGVKRASGTLGNAVFTARNLLQEYVRQSSGGQQKDSRRPLVEVEAFLSKLRQDPSLAQRFVSGELTERQQALVAQLTERLPGFSEAVRETLPAWNPDRAQYAHEDYIEYFRDPETGALDENVETAIAGAMFNWLGDEASHYTNSDKEINTILNRDSKAAVTRKQGERLRRIGTRQPVVINDLGQWAAEALGLTVDNGVPQDLMPKLVGALGGRALAALAQGGYVQVNTIPETEMAALKGNKVNPQSANAGHRFVAMAQGAQDAPRREARDIAEARQGTESLMAKLFGAEDKARPPSLKPVPFKNRRPKRSLMHAPKTLVRILADENKKAHYVETDMWSLWSQLDEATQLKAAGGNPKDTGKIHKGRRLSTQAKNEGLVREARQFADYVATLEAQEHGLATPFFLDREIWSMQRVGLLGTMVNPQSSKIHRYLTKMGGWESEVQMDNSDGSLDQFWLTVGEALGVKTDSQTNDVSIQEAQDKAANPVIEAGVIAIMKQRNNEVLQEADRAAIAKAVDKGGEDMHSLAGLMALAKWIEAGEAWQARFTHTLTREIDGKTNGPILAQLLLGAAETPEELHAMVVRGGFFTQGDNAEHIGEWASRPGNHDLYQKVTTRLGEIASQDIRKRPATRAHYAAIGYFTGSWVDKDGKVTGAGRNLVKTPTTALTFGSGMKSVLDSMATEMLDKVYTRIEEVAALDPSDPKREQRREAIIRHINTLVGGNYLREDMTLEQLMEHELTPQAEAAFRKQFSDGFGQAVDDTMNEVFKPFIERRQVFNATANAAFHLYDLAYRVERQKLKSELKAQELLPYRHKKKNFGKDQELQLLQDLTPDQEAEVRARVEKILPVMNSAFSKHDGDLGAGLALVKRKKHYDGSPTYSNLTKLPKGAKILGRQSVVSYGKRLQDEAPGVASVILGTHSLDSFGAAMSYTELQALNVHDALVVAMLEAQKAGKALNKNIFDGLVFYSPGREIGEAYGRTLDAFNEYVADNNLMANPQFRALFDEKVAEINKAWSYKSQQGLGILGFLRNLSMMEAQKADSVKLRFMKTLTAVSQYTLQDAHHAVTDADRTRIDKELVRATQPLPKDLTASAEAIAAQYTTPGKRTQSAPEAVAAEEGPTVPANETTEVPADEENRVDVSTETLEDTGTTPGADVAPGTAEAMLAELEAHTYTSEPVKMELLVRVARQGASPATRQILDRLAQHPQVKATGVFLHGFSNGSLGTLQGAQPALDQGQTLTLNVKALRKIANGRRNFAGNNAAETIAETIVHEMIHAATLEVLRSEGREGRRLNRRLTEIQGDIQAWIDANPNAHEQLDDTTRQALRNMLANPLEVPSYGLTAKRVQDVLRRIPSRNSQGSVWSRFVKAIREALNLKGSRVTVLDDILQATDEALSASPESTVNGDVTLAIEGPDGHTPMDFSTREIYAALKAQQEAMPESQAEALDSLLDQVETLHGPFGAFKDRARQTEAVSAEDAFLKALQSGQAPFVSLSRNAGFRINDAEAFVLEQVEATLRASLEHPGTNDVAREELKKVWREARDRLKTDATLSQDQKDFLFRLDAAKGTRDDHLARFAALALTHAPLREKLDYASRDIQAAPEGLVQRLQELLRKVLNILHGRLSNTFDGQRADDKVWALMDRLVEIESRRRRRLTDDTVTWKDRVADTIDDTVDGVRDRVIQFGKSDFVAQRRYGIARAVPKIAAVVAAERTDELMGHMEAVRRRMFKQKQGVVASLVNEARGAHDKATRKAHELLRTLAKKNEQERQQQFDTYRKTVLESFSDNGRNLSAEDKAAVTRMILDTDMAALLDRYSEEQLLTLVDDPKALQQAIQEAEAEVLQVGGQWADYYLGAARDLAWAMATGEVTSQHLLRNAHNIAGMYGTRFQSQISEAQQQAAKAVLDPLISLQAMAYTPDEYRKRTAEVMRQETARGKASGIGMVLALHRRMQQDAREHLFEDSEALMQKGYRAQITNPYKSVETVPLSAVADFEAMGYTALDILPRDPHHPYGPKEEQQVLMVIHDGGRNRRLSGIVSTTNETAQGTLLHGGETSPAFDGRNPINQRRNQKILAQRDGYIQSLVRQGRNHDPRQSTFRSHLAPVINPRGEVVNYRYLMKHTTRDTVLERNNAVDDVFGTMAAQAFDKVTSKVQNRTAIEALKGQYDEEYAQNPDAYVRIAADSPDKQYAEAFKLLPDAAKQAVRELWGGQELWVRGDLVDIFFGYQKYSLADSFKKVPEERRAIEQVFTYLMKLMFGKKAYLRASQGGALWTGLVKEVKDILVIKRGVTLIGNVMSNLSLLIWHDVPMKNLARDHRIAFEGLLRYRRDRNELDQLRLQLDAGQVNDRNVTEQRIRELERDLEQNPIAFMIDEGMMPTIVEDVDMHDDPYSYKSLLQEKTEAYTGRLPKAVRTAGRYAYMTHDTWMYKALSQGTQLSDFVARYALYQHLTTRKRHRMSHADAIQRASDMFINYDIPTHRMVQYLNDIGLLLFTKYYIRIQRAIFTLMREHPGRGLLMTTLNSIMPGLDLLTDSQFLNKGGLSVAEGALGYLDSLGELPLVKAALSPFN